MNPASQVLDRMRYRPLHVRLGEHLLDRLWGSLWDRLRGRLLDRLWVGLGWRT